MDNLRGAVAQLGERLNGIQEVVGSIPISSTKKIKRLANYWLTSFFIVCVFPVYGRNLSPNFYPKKTREICQVFFANYTF
jgi:hypothetical protein